MADEQGNVEMPPWWKPTWLKIGGVLTALWVIGVVWLFCFNQVSGFVERPGGFLGGPKTLDLNELGDLLAGLFAPLAFLWLLIAVMVQAKELSLQRRELALTRREFKENRKVAEASRLEIAAQTRALTSQTDILDRQLVRTIQVNADDQIGRALGDLGDLLRSESVAGGWHYRHRRTRAQGNFDLTSARLDTLSRIRQFNANVPNAAINKGFNLHELELTNDGAHLLDSVKAIIELMMLFEDSASPVTRATLQRLRIADTAAAVEKGRTLPRATL